jgi:hypothetical protein
MDELDSYDHESGLLSTETIATEALKLWCTRLTEPDSTVPGRSWSVELTVGALQEKAFFGLGLSCFSRNLDFTFDPAVPRIYKDVVSKNILFGDGIRLSRYAVDVESDDDVDWLVSLINNPNRRRNIVAISSDPTGSCAANPDRRFADRLCGVAHVVRIFPEATFLLSQKVGKYLSVFDLGIRIYKPTLRLEGDEPLRHTLYTRHRLAALGIDKVQHAILSDAFRASVEWSLSSQALPTFVRIRSAKAASMAAQLQAQQGASNVTSIENRLAASEVARMAAEAQAREALDLSVQEEIARTEAENERNQERARSMVLAARVRALEARLGSNTELSAIRPKAYEEIPAWVEVEFAGRMKILPRALRALRDAEFEDIGLVCDLLQLLAVEYVDARRGTRDAWSHYDDELTTLGVVHSKSISAARAGEQGEEYFVKFRGSRQLLEWHLKKGTSRDPRRDLRIYFFWDDEDEEVIIGYLPGHLDNRIT